MPRKKTVQPKPLAIIKWLEPDPSWGMGYVPHIYEPFSGLAGLVPGEVRTLEVRDETCRLSGSGLHNHYAFEAKVQKVWGYVFKDYFVRVPGGDLECTKPANDYLKNGSSFVKEIQLRGLCGVNGSDDSRWRKQVYKALVKKMETARDAIKRKELDGAWWARWRNINDQTG
ncbi:hypothetical protein [Nitrosomonas eutropha]|uniref:Uncharacterized protein n=2 Tax=Nitrosomonas eutropha TaxID=916 RepID=A0ABX5M8L6_9PROT|nr:hypothetical protein [Nitrosomonas eutropha]ABI60708.1 hypothetical protein Neut_2504 [Nitrosomonas eutropha C91]PXV79439.1 hypothetical protein C8R14_12350 [Nitrosomonas eutropha]SEI48079.1 hypothetical protein SAMN05216318_1044 [Nitrosomonas eutropha]